MKNKQHALSEPYMYLLTKGENVSKTFYFLQHVRHVPKMFTALELCENHNKSYLFIWRHYQFPIYQRRSDSTKVLKQQSSLNTDKFNKSIFKGPFRKQDVFYKQDTCTSITDYGTPLSADWQKNRIHGLGCYYGYDNPPCGTASSTLMQRFPSCSTVRLSSAGRMDLMALCICVLSSLSSPTWNSRRG